LPSIPSDYALTLELAQARVDRLPRSPDQGRELFLADREVDHEPVSLSASEALGQLEQDARHSAEDGAEDEMLDAALDLLEPRSDLLGDRQDYLRMRGEDSPASRPRCMR